MADLSAALHLPPARTLLVLGRVSNLPTVWTNVLAATVISGADPWSAATLLVAVAMSAFYTGGMFLNDAFDREIDARERPGRPIPAGQVAAGAVFAIGYGLIALGLALLLLFSTAALFAGIALAATIIAYDLHHKDNPLGPVVMGLCRALVYVATASALGEVSLAIVAAAIAVFAHVVGLTYAAKQEAVDRVGALWPLAILAAPVAIALPALFANPVVPLAILALAVADIAAVRLLRARDRPGAVPAAVGALIAAVCLVDAALAAPHAPAVALACAGFYILTCLLHRIVPGT